MGRWHQHSLVLAAALGVSGCLLFADPINKAPTVTIKTQATVIYRNSSVDFTATVSDDKDPPAALQLRWSVFPAKENACKWVTAAQFLPGIAATPIDEPYSFEPTTLDITCVCAEVTDRSGATGSACYPPIKPVIPTPVIVDESGALSGQARPRCSQIHLFAENTDYPSGDPLQTSWTIEYSGSDPTGSSVQLSACDGVTTNKAAHRCFSASLLGTYKVSVAIVNSADPTAPASNTSDAFVIPVNVDTPPCIRRTEPDVYAQRILLSGGADLGGSYQSRTFKATSVDDDCEPYPMVSGSIGQTQFVWSVLDSTGSAAASWARQTDASESFTVSQANFPNARPGDTIEVRLEVRDTPVQATYDRGKGTYSVCPDSTEFCCGTSDCTGANACVRWTTWTVQFQP